MCKKFDDVEVYTLQSSDKSLTITILKGGYNHEDPASYMDGVVEDYVKNRAYNEFIETNLDLPWVRVIIEGINEIAFTKYPKDE